MVVVALDCCCGFLEADVVESSKGSSADVLNRVVGHQKLLLKGTGRHINGSTSETTSYGQIKKHTFHLIKI